MSISRVILSSTQVFGPLALMKHGHFPRGVRFIERDAALDMPRFLETLAEHDAHSCGQVLGAAVQFYQELREAHADERFVRRVDAEREALKYLEVVIVRSE